MSCPALRAGVSQSARGMELKPVNRHMHMARHQKPGAASPLVPPDASSRASHSDELAIGVTEMRWDPAQTHIMENVLFVL